MLWELASWSRDGGVAPAGFGGVSTGLGWMSMVTAGHQQAERCPLSRRIRTNELWRRERGV